MSPNQHTRSHTTHSRACKTQPKGASNVGIGPERVGNGEAIISRIVTKQPRQQGLAVWCSTAAAAHAVTFRHATRCSRASPSMTTTISTACPSVDLMECTASSAAARTRSHSQRYESRLVKILVCRAAARSPASASVVIRSSEAFVGRPFGPRARLAAKQAKRMAKT